MLWRDCLDELMSTQTGLLKKQLQDMRDESTTLKSTIHRLNTELSRYQAQFRSLTDKEVSCSCALQQYSLSEWIVWIF